MLFQVIEGLYIIHVCAANIIQASESSDGKYGITINVAVLFNNSSCHDNLSLSVTLYDPN